MVSCSDYIFYRYLIIIIKLFYDENSQRVIEFLDDFEEAKEKKEKRRKILPGLYNPARLTELPLPLTEIEKNESEPHTDQTDSGSCSVAVATAIERSATSATVATDVTIGTQNDPVETHLNETGVASETDTAEINIDSSNYGVFGNQSDFNSSARSTVTADMLSSALNAALMIKAPVKKDPEFSSLNAQDEQAVEEVLNNSYEVCDDEGDVLISTNDMLPMPIAERNPYEMKSNDILSANMPYATNVSFL